MSSEDKEINIDMLRIPLEFAPGVKIRFIGREIALRKIVEWSERGVGFPIVVYGPEGCGKTSWLRQSIKILEKMDYKVIYVNPAEENFENALIYTEDIKDIIREVVTQGLQHIEIPMSSLITRLSDLVFTIAYRIMKKLRKPKIAVLIDEAFQRMELREASSYVKSLLNMIEHSSYEYDKIIAIVATSEGVSRSEIGRHMWAHIMSMWNMSENDFRELYDQIPGEKPSFEDVWRITGGNPRIFRQLYSMRWNIDDAIDYIVRSKELTPDFISRWRRSLEEAVEDPDNIWRSETSREFIDELIRKNLIVYNLYERRPGLWIDQPPPEKDLDIGVGRYVAWQTPLYREAVRKALKKIDR